MSTGTQPLAGQAVFEDEHKAYRESFRTFLARRVAPHYGQWRRQGRMPRELFSSCGEDGFLGMQVPERYGGPGVEDRRFGTVIVQEAMRANASALALALIGHNDAAVAALVSHGSDSQQAAWLSALASGAALAAIVDGDIRLEGRSVTGNATFVVQGAQADLFVVLAASRNDSTERRLVLVERGADGVSVDQSQPPIGLEAAALAAVSFDHAGAEVLGDGTRPARELAMDLELGLATPALAGARAAFETTLAYVADRKAFGQPIASFQNTRHQLASVSASIAAAEAFHGACLQQRVAGVLTVATAAAAKLHCTELYGDVVDRGVQLHGGYGYMLEYEIAHAYADARFWRLYGGSSEAMKETIADELFH
jgi:alkylation response protein AidB-like acyl-CoA dehydrogenase